MKLWLVFILLHLPLESANLFKSDAYIFMQQSQLELPAKSMDYYSLKDAARHLEISPNKVAVLVQKGILKKDLNNPLSIQVQASSLLNIKKKLNNEEYIPYLDAANQLNCPINWMK
ncbi:MAG: hypothetical protein RR676_15295, partial [Acinetobacter sp.]